jgi:cytochrome c oxidase subunit 1
MIAKQYLITGIMGIIGVNVLLFRMQLAWPEESFKIFNVLLGDNKMVLMTNDIYLSLSHDTRYHNGIFVLTAALVVPFSNLLIPLQIGRDMASGFMNMISYWLFSFYPV